MCRLHLVLLQGCIHDKLFATRTAPSGPVPCKLPRTARPYENPCKPVSFQLELKHGCVQSYGQVGYTPAGRAYSLADGTFGATANAAFLGLAFGQIIRPWRPDLADIYLCWARQQVCPAPCLTAARQRTLTTLGMTC